MALLNVIDGPARGRAFELAQRSVLIGRDESCAISIPDGRISRRHLQIVYDPDGDLHVAVDVGSSNGVVVNGLVLKRGAEQALKDGDEIGIGDSRLRYTKDPTSQGFQAASRPAAMGFDAPSVDPWSVETPPG